MGRQLRKIARKWWRRWKRSNQNGSGPPQGGHGGVDLVVRDSLVAYISCSVSGVKKLQRKSQRMAREANCHVPRSGHLTNCRA